MNIQYEKANSEDYEEVIDLANYVFSANGVPHDFPALLPKLYRREYFMDADHYIVRENGRIKAIVGSYPLNMKISGEDLRGRGIGMVSVHPYARSSGYMRRLMDAALADIQGAGEDFCCLIGKRQRYEYFGFTPAGSVFRFECNRDNIRHTLKTQPPSKDLRLKPVSADDLDYLEQIRLTHEAKPAYYQRRKDRFFDILSSWKSGVYAVLEKDMFQGYLIYRKNTVYEINLKDYSRIPAVLGLLFEKTGSESDSALTVAAAPHETEKRAALSRFAEECEIGPAYGFNVFDYPRFVQAFVKLKNTCRKIADGSFTLAVQRNNGTETRLRFCARDGRAELAETNDSADITLGHLEALNFLFSPDAVYTHQAVAERPFLQSLLPLPLFFESADGV